ncbi:DUF2917 domain-containing protein [Undibacterium sp.]|uniref:DUF2917 domain-containing protein n=1 Tax=Undibacterium sp. TaxID=1914977 RepID=UPI00374CAE6E
MHTIVKQLLSSISHSRAEDTSANMQRLAETIRVVKHQNIHLPDLPLVTVRALCGTVWITRNGDPDDIVLESGEAVDLQQGDDVIISGLSDAYIRLRPTETLAGSPAGTLSRLHSKVRREAAAQPCPEPA